MTTPRWRALTVAGPVGSSSLEPSPLSEQAVGQLARAMLGMSTPDSGLRGRVPPGDRRQSLPLHDAHRRPRGGHRRDPTLAVVVRRLGRLGAGPLRLARAVAILGAYVPVHRAAALADLGAHEAAAAHAELAERVVLRPETPLEFVHPLVRAAIREDVPAAERGAPPRRRRTHAPRARCERRDGRGPAPARRGGRRGVGGGRVARGGLDGGRQGRSGVAASFLRRALAERPDHGEVRASSRARSCAAGKPEPAIAHLEDALRLTTDDATRIASLRLLASAPTASALEDAWRACSRGGPLLDAGDDLVLELEAELLGMTSIEPSAFGRREDLDRPGFLPAGRTRGERAWLAAGATSAFFALRPAQEVVALGRRALDGGLFEDHRAGFRGLEHPCASR